MPWGRGLRPARVTWSALLVLALTLSGSVATAGATAAPPVLRVHTDLAAGPRLMGLGVQWDPYDSFRPTPADWNRTFQRLDFMHPGFIRVVEPAFDYFAGYDAAHLPTYRWNARHLIQLRTILDYAKSRRIPVVLGDWSNPMINGDPRIPADFLAQLHDAYGYTNIRYYNLINEPNYVAGCDFGCWTGSVTALANEFSALGISKWLALVGPDNANSWDDTPSAQALDRTTGLDTDNPIGGDSWLTNTLEAIPRLIGAYDSHRYATTWGLENGVYQDQMRARREQISNLDSPGKQYFAGEIGLTARLIDPFSRLMTRSALRSLAPLIDPSIVPRSGTFVDSQPHIREFGYGVWMADMMIQGIDAGMSGGSAWDLDDAMHVGGQYGSQNLKQWGFWNSLGGQDGYPAADLQPRPWYYSWSVLARGFPAGSQALVLPSLRVPGLRVAAAKISDAGNYGLSIAVVNDSDTPRSIRLSVPSAAGPLTLNRYDDFAAEHPVDAGGLPLPTTVLQDAVLSAGMTIHLPSRGLVVLSTIGTGTSIKLKDGAKTLRDGLGDWRQVYSHSGAWKLDHSEPAYFNEDHSRATAKANAKHAPYLIYRATQMTGFELTTYYHDRLGILAYGSPDGRSWTPISLASTHPAPALGGGQWYLAELLPGQMLPAGTNWLKLQLTDHRTELSSVTVRHG